MTKLSNEIQRAKRWSVYVVLDPAMRRVGFTVARDFGETGPRYGLDEKRKAEAEAMRRNYPCNPN